MNQLKRLKAELEKLYAVELLEYHDKNYLSGDNCSRSESRQKQLQYCMRIVQEIQDEMSVTKTNTEVVKNRPPIISDYRTG